MEAQEQKKLHAEQSSILFNQHHQVHLVRRHQQRDTPQRRSWASCLTVSLCCLQKREKRKEEEQRRKEWVDQEREKTLSRLRSFREVRLCRCLPAASPLLMKPQRLLLHSAAVGRICAQHQTLWTCFVSVSCLTAEL